MSRMSSKLISAIFAFVLFMTLIPQTSVYATASEYTIKFRAGNVNTIRIESLDSNVFEVTENYFSLRIQAGRTVREGISEALGISNLSDEGIQDFFEYALCENEQYRLDDVKNWCEDLDKVIHHNESYVMDYRKIVNPVKYTVYFLDTEDRSQIASPWIRYVDATEGMTQIRVAPLEIQEYATTNTEVVIDLTQAGDKNVEFFYAYVGPFVHIPSGEPGEIIYNDIIQEIVVNAPAVNGQQQPEANGGGQNQPVQQPEANENPGGNENPNGGQTGIDEPQTPLAPSTEIPDEDVPLYHGGRETSNPLKNVAFLGGIAGSLLIFGAIVFLIIHNQRRHEELSSDEKNTKQ